MVDGMTPEVPSQGHAAYMAWHIYHMLVFWYWAAYSLPWFLTGSLDVERFVVGYCLTDVQPMCCFRCFWHVVDHRSWCLQWGWK